MAPTMIDVPMDAQALREILPTPTFEPEMINIPIDSEALQAACTGIATTIIKEVRVEGVSGWWLVLTIVIALIAIGGVVIATDKAQLRLVRELRGLPPHKLHEKLEERYHRILEESPGSELDNYVAKEYKGAIYEDDLVKKERTIKIVQDLSRGATQVQNQNENQPQTQTQLETSAAKDQEMDELNETIGLIKGSSSSSDSDSDSEFWSDISPEEREEKEKRPPSPWKSTE
jgi:hypothetical protein